MPFSQHFMEDLTEGYVASQRAVMIAQMSLRRLRAAIHSHRVSFPSQVPIFACQSRAEVQWRMVELYFVCNWSCAHVGQRYGVTPERVRQMVTLWVRRAVFLGYLQEIPVAQKVPVTQATREPESERRLVVSTGLRTPELESDSLRAVSNYQ